jgi:DNA polymerase-3 subunit gamma/tau
MNLAERMRPKTLNEVIGNLHIVKPLRKQLETGTLSQTMMITGQFGSGKTTIAKIIASELDAEVYEIDCGSDGGVDRMREIVDSAYVSSLFSKNKVFILDEVHGLSKQAQSALLKTLEEAKVGVYFILLTTEEKKILPTIRSRCVVYETDAANKEDIGIAVHRVLKEFNLTVENMADFWSVVYQSEGSLRQVYSLMEKLVASADEDGFISSEVFKSVLKDSSSEEVDENLPRAFLDRDIKESLETISRIKKESNVISTTIGLYNYLKAVYVRSGKGNKELLADMSFLLSHKQIEWEHLEWLVWKHL